MKIEDDFMENKEYDNLLDCKNPSKFLVLGSLVSDTRLKQLKDRFKASKTKVMYCTYEDCLKKSASHYLSRFIRAKEWRWNFKLNDSTVPEMDVRHEFLKRKKLNKAFILKTIIACIFLAIFVAFYSSNSPTELSGRSYFNDITKISKNDEDIYGYIIIKEELIRLTIYGAQTKHEIAIMNKRKENFVFDFLTIFKHPKFKAIIIQMNSKQERNEFLTIVSRLRIPFLFVDEDIFKYSSILMVSNININFGECIVLVLLTEGEFKRSELQYTKDGYISTEKLNVPRQDFVFGETTPELIRHKIIGTRNPVKIILHANYAGLSTMKFLKDIVLKDDFEIVISLEESFKNYEERFLFETVKWMFNKSYTNFHIEQNKNRKYFIGCKCGEKEYPLIVFDNNESQSYKKKIFIQKSPLQYFIGSTNLNNNDFIIHSALKFSENTHLYQISLKNDGDNFVLSSSTREANIPFLNYAVKFDCTLPSKIPVIAFYGDLSFIYISDGIFGYNILDSWNGKYGKELYISFNERQPKFFDQASKILSSTCSYVVHDIIKVLSYSPEDIPLSNPTFGYNITKDSENQILFTVNTFNGIKKKSPTALMALFLKKHIKEIQQKLKKRPTEIALYLFEEFDKAAENRIRNGLKESCKMAKIDCSFVETLPLELINS
uniref:Uncharacterized protein n=1 Tax=Panagrolaimus sp. PS1159 TaxID=55785 RepID=A0AC35GF72_9BILA